MIVPTDVATSVPTSAGRRLRRAPDYEHAEVGYTYRMSNLLAAPDCGQLRNFDAIAGRCWIQRRYTGGLGALPGVAFVADGVCAPSKAWLTGLTFDPEAAGVECESVRRHLSAGGVEARPVRKPLHLQPANTVMRVLGGDTDARPCTDGICLPSGSSLDDLDGAETCDEVCEILR